MRTKLLVLAGMLFGLSAWGQATLLYTGTFTSPYDSGTQITLQLWGNPGDKAQEHVDYMFKGRGASVSNTVRIDFATTLKATWGISAVTSPPTIRQVYANLAGNTVASLPTTALSYAAALSLTGGSTQTLSSATTQQNGSWDFGSPWTSSSTGSWWATFSGTTNLAPMFTYDNSLASPKLTSSGSGYQQSKTVQLELVKNNSSALSFSQPAISGSILKSTLTSTAGSSATQPSWRALNLWVNGVLQSSTALTVGSSTTSNGVRTDPLSWAYAANSTYQLQAVDGLGNSQSVWYPNQSQRFAPLGSVLQVAAGYQSSFVLKSDGTVWSWGFNQYGQLGIGSTNLCPVPVQVKGLTGVTAIVVAGVHTMALKSDGTVWAWGYNAEGELGNNSNTNSAFPVQVSGLTNIVSIAAGGGEFALALKSDGTVWAWGDNNFWELGNPAYNNYTFNTVPVQVSQLTGVVAIAAGESHALALKSDGTVWGWGDNGDGELGNGTKSSGRTLTQVKGLTGAVAIAAGWSHSMALTADGTVWTWGDNTFGELGNNSTVGSSQPIPVSGLTGIVSIIASMGRVSQVVKSDGTIWAWGDNGSNQLGTSSIPQSLVPLQISGIDGATSLAVGSNHSLALKPDGSVWAWGANTWSALGNNLYPDSVTPVRVLGLPLDSLITGGGQHTLAVTSQGTVLAWGYNSNGQLGEGAPVDADVPFPVTGLTNVVSVAGAQETSFAIRSDGTVWGWGANSFGQLGNDTATDSQSPVQATGLTSVVAVAGDDSHTVALKNDGTVWAWGSNTRGELGNGTNTSSRVPVQSGVSAGLTGVISIAVGGGFSLALKSDGTVWAWGYNAYGALGGSTPASSNTPMQILGLGNVTAIAAGNGHGMALTSDGSVWTWGWGQYGQLGNGNVSNVYSPVRALGLSNVVMIAAGAELSVALKSDGTVWAWGDNTFHQLGAGAVGSSSSTPIQVLGLSQIVEIAAENYDVLAYRSDGTIWSCGYDSNGQVGNGYVESSSPLVSTNLPLGFDTTPPTLIVSSPPLTADKTWVATGVTLTDDLSGINLASCKYIIDSNSQWSGTFSVNNGVISINTSTVPSNTITTPTHTIVFAVYDNAGNSATKSFTFTIDRAGPTITATTPNYVGSSWKATKVSIVDTISGVNASSFQYSLDGGPLLLLMVSGATATSNGSISGGTISLDISSLSEGSHTIVLSASNNAGYSSTASYSFTVDLTGPVITANVPPAINSSSMTLNLASLFDAISGVTGPNGGTGLWWLDSASQPQNASTFAPTNGSVTLALGTLTEGQHTLYVSATDTVGNTTVTPFSFRFDTTPPTLSASVPGWSNKTMTMVIGPVTLTDGNSGPDPSSVLWWVDSALGTPSTLPIRGGTIQLPDLAEGQHTLNLRGADNAKNTVVVPYTFWVDKTVPTVSASVAGFANASLALTNVVFTDALSGPNGSLTWWIDTSAPSSLTVASDGSASVPTAALSAGPHYLYLKGSDVAGNATTQSYPFTVDQSAPTLTVTAGSYVSAAGTLALTVSASDVAGITGLSYTIDGAGVTSLPATGGTLTLAINPALIQGTHTLVLTALDAVGNSTTSPGYTFTVDRTPPVLAAQVPGWANANLGGTGVSLTDALSGPNGIQYSIDGGASSALTVSSGAFSLDVSSLAVGAHSLTLVGSDKAGNTASTTASFTIVRQAPALTDVGLTENGTPIGVADDLQGGTDLVAPVYSDAAPVQFRVLVNQSGKSPSDSDWNSSTYSSWSTAPFDISTLVSGFPLSYLYVQAKDAAGNLSAVTERVIRVDNASPGVTTIRSTTFPYAQSARDAVAQTVGIFQFSVASTGPSGLKSYDWALYQSATAPVPGTSTPLQTGSAATGLTLPGLADTATGQFYWLAVRAVGGNGRAGAWALYPFAVNTTPPRYLTVTSSTHPLPGVAYQGTQASFSWNQPADFNGVKSYYYKWTTLPLGASWTAPSTIDGTWTTTGQASLVVPNLAGSGQIAVAVAAQDWSGNTAYASFVATYDNTAPTWDSTDTSHTVSMVPDPNNRVAVLNWKNAIDDISSAGNGLVYGVELQDITASPYVEVSHWQYLSQLPSSMQTTFSGLVVGHSYLATVAVIDGAGNPLVLPLAFQEADPASQVVPPYQVAYQLNFGGLSVTGHTTYTGASITAQDAALTLGSPLVAPGTNPPSSWNLPNLTPTGPAWAPVPSAAADPNASLLWSANGLSGPVTGVSLDANGLSLGTLTLPLPLSDNQGNTSLNVSFNHVAVGPAPAFSFVSSDTAPIPAGETLTTSDGWTVTSLQGAKLTGLGWSLQTANAAPTDQRFSISLDAQDAQTAPLNLTGAQVVGTSVARGPVTIPSGGLYVTAHGLTVQVVHATVVGARLEIEQAYAVVAGLGPTDLELDDLVIDGQGQFTAGSAFASHLAGPISTPYGTLTAGTNAFTIQSGQLVLSQASLTRADGSTVALTGAVFDSQGMTAQGGTVSGTFDGVYFGFPVHGVGGTIVSGVRVFDSATIDMPAYGVTGLSLTGLGISLTNDTLAATGTASGPVSLTTAYGSGINASNLALAPTGVSASLTAALPAAWGGTLLSLGTRSLASTGSVGSAPATVYPSVAYSGFTLQLAAANLTSLGLALEVSLNSYTPISGSVAFSGLTLRSDGTVSQAGTASSIVDAATYPVANSSPVTWNLSFPTLRVDAGGIDGEPTIPLPQALGGTDYTLGTTTLHPDGTVTTQPASASIQMTVFGWTASATTLSLNGPDFQLGGTTVELPGIMQGNDIPVGNLEVDQTGNLVSTDQASPTVFRGTNGFQVTATNVRFDPRGLTMGGQVLLPGPVGGAAVNFPDGSLFLEPDGALLGEVNGTSVTLQFASFSITATRVVLDRTGMTISGGSVTPLGLVPIALPDFTIYSTGELAVAGQSISSGSFTLSGGVTVAYSGIRFSDAGLSLSASVSLPPAWGSQTLDFDDLTVSSDGHISSSASLQNLVIPLDTLGMSATIGTLRLAQDGFHIDDVQFQFSQGDLSGQSLSVGSALIDWSGNLNLYGFSFAPITLFGYQVTLTGLTIGHSGIGLSGGITLPSSLPIPELAGLYLAIQKFDVGFDGSIQDFQVSLDQGFSMTVFNSWTVGIQGFTISKNLMTISQATLDLPASFNLPQLQVSGLTIDLASGQITWGQIAVSGVSYQWNGLNFQLTSLKIDPDNGLIFAGSVAIPATSSNGTPYPAPLANRTLVVDSLQILPTGLPGNISATLTGINGPLFDENILLSNASITLGNQNGNLIFGFTGGLKLGAAFPAGLAGLVINIQALTVNVSDGSFGALAVQATAADGLGTLSLPGGIAFVPQSIGLAAAGSGYEVDASGVFQTNATFPGALANLTVPIQTFRMDSSGHLIALQASTAIPEGASLSGGLTLSGANVGVSYPGPDGGMDFSVSGQVKLGSAFLDGLSGMTLDIRSLVLGGSGSLIALDVGTSWTGARSLFGTATVNNGSVNVKGSGTAPWTVSVGGTLQLPDTLPQGLAGLQITIGTLVFQTDGTIKQADIATAPLNVNLFNAAQLNNATLQFSRYDSHALRIDVTGATLSLPSTLGTGLGGLTANVDQFSMTTAGALLALNGSIPLAPSIPLFAGINVTQSQLGFSATGVSVSGKLDLPTSMLEGAPSLVVQRAVFGWNGKLLDLAAGLAHATVLLGGFTTDVTNLTVSTSGVALQSAVLTLPPDLGSRQISIVNAGFTTSGVFTGTVGINEIDQTIAGFGLQLTGISLDVSSRVLRVVSARLQTPNIGSLGGYVQLNAITVGPSGMSLGGVGFSLPDFDYGGVGFRSIYVNFSISGSTYFIAGGGQASITGLGTLDAQLSFTNVSSTYPIGLQRAYFQYTMTPGIPLGTTGLYLNQIRGGFAYGPPNELPSTLKPLFDDTGPRLQLGVGVSTAAGSGVLQMNANFWIDVHNAAWAFDGNATVLSGLTTGDLEAGYGNSIFYGAFSFEMIFVDGKVQIWIFPYHGSTVFSGEGDVEFILHKGSLLHWHIDLGIFGSYDVDFPTSNWGFGGISAEFGQFNKGAGVEGAIDVPCWGRVGAFVNGGGMHFNISDYDLIKPAGY